MGRLSDKVFEVISAGIIYLDSDLQIVQSNNLGKQAIGADRSAELTGKIFFDVANINSAGLKIAFQQILSDKKTRSFWGFPVAAQDSSEKTFWDYTISELDGGIVLSAVEVTSRIKAERGAQGAVEELRQSTDKLQSVIQQMTDGVIVCDAEGNATKINLAAETLFKQNSAIFGIGKEESQKSYTENIRHTSGHIFPPEQYPWFLASSQGITTIDTELLIHRADNDEAVISVNAAPLYDKDKNISGSVTILRDVTENRHLISDLRKANKQLEEYNRLKAEFVANMSHELRTPLTAIIGFAQLMQMRGGKDKNLPEPVSDGLERILRNGRHLLTLIDQVLDLSKIEAGRLTLHLDHFDVSELVEKTFGGLESLAIEKGLRYNLKVDEKFPIAFSDPARIRQIILNLISNAIKYTEKGEISITLKSHNENEWELIVQDSGVGIKKESLNEIFERFRQVDGSFTRNVGGFGLGLSISRELAELLGGKITVDSNYGEGSTFILKLPYEAPMANSTLNIQSKNQERFDFDSIENVGSSDERDESSRPLVLIIDDLTDSTQLLGETLSNAGYRISIANSGAEGLRMARQLSPNLVTLDVMMPGMDGWRVLQEMKADAKLAQIPVVVVSIVDNKPLGYRLGASNYLVKPVAPENLLETLNTVISAPNEGNSDYVLVVDDEQSVRELLTSALKQGGYKTQSASSGEIGLAQALKHPPIAILTDLHMPGGMSGYELIARLRSDAGTTNTPIIVITGKDLMAEDRKFISGRIADVIRKGDLLISDLDSRLRETLEEIGVKPTNGKSISG